jgi:hypothetical protein
MQDRLLPGSIHDRYYERPKRYFKIPFLQECERKSSFRGQICKNSDWRQNKWTKFIPGKN